MTAWQITQPLLRWPLELGSSLRPHSTSYVTGASGTVVSPSRARGKRAFGTQTAKNSSNVKLKSRRMVYSSGKSCTLRFNDFRRTAGNDNEIFHHWPPLLSEEGGCCSFQLESVFNRISCDGASMFIVCIVLKSTVRRMGPCSYERVTQINTRVSI